MTRDWDKEEIRLTRYAWRLRDRHEAARKRRVAKIAWLATIFIAAGLIVGAPGEALIVLLGLPLILVLLVKVLE